MAKVKCWCQFTYSPNARGDRWRSLAGSIQLERHDLRVLLRRSIDSQVIAFRRRMSKPIPLPKAHGVQCVWEAHHMMAAVVRFQVFVDQQLLERGEFKPANIRKWQTMAKDLLHSKYSTPAIAERKRPPALKLQAG